MFDLEPDEARLLLNIALMAVGRNRFRSAAKLLAMLEKYRPDHPSVAVANAIALISAMQYDAALSYIDGEALKKFPDSAMLKTFKGMALLKMERREDALLPLQEAASQTEDTAAANLAKELLNE